PDVGGGFGTKLFPYREYALLAVASRKLKKTIRWAADRADHFMGDAQGRDNVTTARMALAEDGKFLAMDVDLMGDMGAYLSTFGPYIPHGGAGMLPDAIRKKNFIQPKALPYKTATSKVYDSGDFAAHMKRAMEVANWKEFPKRARLAKKAGLVRGIGWRAMSKSAAPWATRPPMCGSIPMATSPS